MNSRPDTYINENIAEHIVNLAEGGDVVERLQAAFLACRPMNGSNDLDMAAAAISDAIAHIIALTEQVQSAPNVSVLWQDFRQNYEDRIHAEKKAAEAIELELAHAELQIQTLQQEIEEIKAAAKIVSAAADRHYNNALHQHEIAELRTNQLDDAHSYISMLTNALTEAHSMLLWCERRMMSPSISSYPKRLAEAIGKILYE